MFHKSNPVKWYKLIYEATNPSDRLHATLLAERLQLTFSWNEVVPTRGQYVGEIGHLLREPSPLLKTRNAKGSNESPPSLVKIVM